MHLSLPHLHLLHELLVAVVSLHQPLVLVLLAHLQVDEDQVRAQDLPRQQQGVTTLVLETKVIRMFPKISQSRRRPLLGPSPG